MKKHRWRKVTAPKTWRPTREGESLIGYYGGQTVRKGTYGEYSLAIVHTEEGSFVVSGSTIIQALDTANLEKGSPIKIVWNGTKNIGRDDSGELRTLKLFDVYIDPTALPQTQTQIDSMIEHAAKLEN